MRLRDRPSETSDETHHAAGAAPGTISTVSIEGHGLYRVGLAYGRFIYRIRWLVIALWVAGVVVSIPFAAKLSTVLTGGGYTFNGSESNKVANILTNTLHQPASQLLVVFQSQDTPVTDPSYQSEVSDFIGKAQDFPHVTSVTQNPGGQQSRDGFTTYVIVNFDGSGDAVEHQLSDFRKLLPSASSGPAKVYLTGNPAVYDTFTQVTQEDSARAEEAALPIALLVLLIVFGTFVASLMPLILAVVAVPVALALIYPIALHNETSVFVTNIASIVGLGISIDYSLFMTRRFRDELAQGRGVRDAIGWTVATAGEAILFSGLTVIIGFIGLMLIGIQFMTSLGIGGAVVVSVAVTAALTLLPALLGAFGARINALRLPLIGKLTAPTPRNGQAEERPGFWHAWAMGVMRRPVLIVLAVIVLLLAMGWPLLSLNIGTPSSSSLPAGTEARLGLDILNQQFPATNENPVVIVAQTPDGSGILSPDNLSKVDNLTRWIAAQPHVTGVISLTQLPAAPGSPSFSEAQLAQIYSTGAYAKDPRLAGLQQFVRQNVSGGTTVITVKTDAKIDSAEGKALIDHLRAGDKDAGQGLVVQVGGFQAVSLDFNRYLYDNFPKAILFILVATYVLLLIMFRSLLLPLKAVLMNVLSVSAAYGMLVFVFQWGNLSNLLNFTSDGFVESTIPILLFCILFGLSMDYEVFLLSRIREEWLRTGNNRFAVARGLEKTGGVITSAALLFVIVAGAFTFTRIIITKEIGLGMTVAVLVDATIIRTLLVPATMRLLGRWNWWLPGRPVPVERVG
ncbi:MAG TPA: MMPL family transporter [Ktedonobacterales bacterium]